MRLGVAVSAVVAFGACASEGVEPQPTEAADAEPPFFVVDRDGVGPVTLAELQIRLPTEVETRLSDEHRACFFEKVATLAEAAGDPETLDPASVAYLPQDGSWSRLTPHAKRAILSQAIVSEAIITCP